jgi:hypothetical protein
MRVSAEQVLDWPSTEVARVCVRRLKEGIQQLERVIAFHSLVDPFPSPKMVGCGEPLGAVAGGQGVMPPEGSNQVPAHRHTGTVTPDEGRQGIKL